MKNAFLVGERVYLRPPEKADVDELMSYLNDSEVLHGLGRWRPASRVEEEEWVANQGKSEHDVVFAVARKDDDRFLGNAGLHRLNFCARKGVLGVFLGAKEEWNKGYGSEAVKLLVKYGFEILNLNRVVLHVFEFNARAVRAYEKAGFQREGVLRQEGYRHGRYWDVWVMGLLREEWEAQFVRRAER